MDGEDGEDFTPSEPTSEEGCDTFVEGGRTFTASTGDDIICGDERRNRINADDGNDTVFGKGSNDTLNGDRGDDALHGGDGDDVLRGGPGKDDLYGNGGNDDFEGGPGNDYMDGGDGNDVFWSLVHGVADGSDDFVGGDGIDTLTFAMVSGAEDVDAPDGWTAGDFTATTMPGDFNDDAAATNPDLSVSLMSGITDFDADNSDVYEGIENLTGSIYDDYLVGDSGDNVINGLAGNDRIEAGAGDDTINPGAGDDFVDGGEGSDTLVVTAATDLSDATTVATNRSIENLQGGVSTSGFALEGNDEANMLTGSSAAGDTLTGNDGKDIFVVVKTGGIDTIADFSITTGATDMIYFKGFDGAKSVTVGTVAGDNDNLNVDGVAVVIVTDAAAAVIVANNLYKFVD